MDSSSFNLRFSGGSLPHSGTDGALKFNSEYDSNFKLYTVDKGKLHCFSLTNEKWTIHTIEDTNYPMGSEASLRYVKRIDSSKDLIVVKVSQGIRMYFYENRNLYLAVQDDQFHDSFEWNKSGNEISFGNFYADPGSVGIMTTHASQGVKFYAIMKKELLNGDFPVFPLDTNTQILDQFSPKRSKIMLARIKSQQQQMIVSKNAAGLDIFTFNAANGINHVMKISHAGDGGTKTSTPQGEELFFPNFSRKQNWNNIAHLNSSGLFLYSFGYSNRYKFVNYNPMFSTAKGWTERHTKTIRFADVDGDGQDDMTFTGPGGIEILKYQVNSNTWKSLLDTSKLSADISMAIALRVGKFESPMLTHHYFNAHLSLWYSSIPQDDWGN